MRVREAHEFIFRGSFSYAYRTIPLPPGTSLEKFAVSEAGQHYENGAHELPGSFHLSQAGNEVRVKWFYRAADEARTFVLEYEIAGAVQKH